MPNRPRVCVAKVPPTPVGKQTPDVDWQRCLVLGLLDILGFHLFKIKQQGGTKVSQGIPSRGSLVLIAAGMFDPGWQESGEPGSHTLPGMQEVIKGLLGWGK